MPAPAPTEPRRQPQPLAVDQTEEWRDVLGGVYQVSNEGRVRRGSRIIKRCNGRKGYTTFCASIANCRKTESVHALVALAFIGPRPDGHIVNHKDGNKHNPRLGNLEYVTHQGNEDHAVAMGLKATGDRHGSRVHPERLRRGETVHTARLVAADVMEIRRLRSGGASLNELADLYGVGFSNISAICRRRTWKHL